MQESKPTSMMIENAPQVAPSLSAQEQSVLYGAVRQKLLNASTTVGAVGGAVGGALIGGIWAIATKGHWGRKLLGTTVIATGLGALVSRMSWGRTSAEQTVNNIQQEIGALPADQQAMAYAQISQQLGGHSQTNDAHIQAQADAASNQQAHAMVEAFAKSQEGQQQAAPTSFADRVSESREQAAEKAL